MTRDYAIILPLMMTVVVATFISQRLSRESIYTLKLKQRGIDVHTQEEIDILEKVKVADVMTRNFPTISPDMKLDELTNTFARSRHHGFPIVDKEGNLRGVVTVADVESKMTKPGEDITAVDVATTHLITAYPDESLHDVMHKSGSSEVGRIPVVDRNDPKKYIGVLRRHDIVKAYVEAQSQTKNQ
jgi:CIC family chloride channel protein